MKLYSIFNSNRLKSYYENVSTIQETSLEVVEEIEEWKVKEIRKKKENKFLIK